MFIRVTRGSYDPAREAETRAFVDEQIVPAFTGLPGFRGYYGGLDLTAGRLVSVTLWATAAQANGLREALGDTVLRGIAEVGVQLEAAEVYEVTAHA